MNLHTFFRVIIGAPQNIKVDLLVETLVDGCKVEFVLVVDVAGKDRSSGVLVKDVGPHGGVLDTVGEPHVLPDVGQLDGSHRTLLKAAFQANNILVLSHHVSVK